MTESILDKSMRGSMYNIVVSLFTIVLGFVRTVLLMRWLADPDPFGLLTLAMFFSTVAIPLATFGVDSALIQAKDPPASAFSTNFVLRLLLGAGMLLLIIVISPILGLVYPTSVVYLIWFLFALNLLEATYSTHSIVLRRELRFGSLAVLNLCASLAMTITAPLLALFGFGIWSLVVERAMGPLVRWVGLWIFVRPWKPSLKLDKQQARQQLQFGSQMVLTNLLGVMLDRFDDFWTGTVLGKTALGFYSRAYDLAQYPERILATPVTNVFFSTYAAVQDNVHELSRAFWQAASFLVRAGLLLSVILLATARELTVILFGETWLPVVPVFRMMLVYIILDPMYVNLSYLLVGVGKLRLLNKVRALQVLAFIISVIGFSSLWDIFGIALAANLMMLIGTVLLFYYSRQIIQISLLRLFGWPVAAAACVGAVTLLISSLSIWSAHPWVEIAVKSLAAIVVYLAILYLTEKAMLKEIIRYTVQLMMPKKEQPRP